MRFTEISPKQIVNESVNRREQFANAIEPQYVKYNDKIRPRLTLGISSINFNAISP